MGKKKNIRRLTTNSYKRSRKLAKKFKFGILVSGLSLSVVVFSFLITIRTSYSDFYIKYMEQYNLLVNGVPNYCSPDNFHPREMIININLEVLNQDVALAEIESNLTSKSSLLSLAVIGSSGIGKTRFSHVFRDNFWWTENIQHYVWSSFESDDINEENLKKSLKNFRSCGKNLLIIDDLAIKHYDIVNNFNINAKEIISSYNISIIIIYIFNLPRYNVNEENFDINLKNFKNNINNSINVIQFQTFNETDLLKCIEMHSKILNISLSNENKDEIIKMINVKRSGCKHIHAKVLLYKIY